MRDYSRSEYVCTPNIINNIQPSSRVTLKKKCIFEDSLKRKFMFTLYQEYTIYRNQIYFFPLLLFPKSEHTFKMLYITQQQVLFSSFSPRSLTISISKTIWPHFYQFEPLYKHLRQVFFGRWSNNLS